jgi:REP element-mobilizing transposase RayT
MSVPRALRLQVAGATYHVAARGNNGRPIFVCDDDRELFLRLLDKIVWRLGWRLHAYCLMTNHFHLLLQTPEQNLADGMQFLIGAYARNFNQVHGRREHLFGRRYLGVMVTREAHFVWLLRYVLRNPVRAGLCDSAGDWRWSSFGATVGDAPRPRFLTVAWALARFGPTHEVACPRLRAYVEEPEGRVPKGLTLIDL